jgi:hypothetical protein
MHEAVATYTPNIIIASWLKMHPRNLLSSDLLSRLNELSHKNHKSADEQKEFVRLYTIYEEAEKGDDITAYRRKNPELQEYILI